MQLLFSAFEQLLFYWSLKAILMVFKLSLRVLIYSPQLILAYLLCRLFLSKADTALLWLIAILLIASLIHFLLLGLKQIILALKSRDNILWIPLLIACIAYTCLFPIWLVFDPVKYLMNYVSAEKALILTWLVCIGFGIYLFRRYDFFNLQSE